VSSLISRILRSPDQVVLQAETVLLDTMSGFEFEEFFAHLLDRLGRGKIAQVLFTQDEGRDILVKTATGLMVVECKHHPNGSIGRPVVQKLHSAIISSGAESGILVTTGHFTKEALAYAQKISPHVEMIDRALLTEMAARAGITMMLKGGALSIWTLTVPAEGVTRTSLNQDLDKALDCYPRSPSALVRDVHRNIGYRPIYLVTYDVNAVFETSIGVIHREQAREAKIVLDGTTGELLEQEVRDFIVDEPQTQLSAIPDELARQIPQFRLDAVAARARGKELIMKIHTKTKYYRGRNHQNYRKNCVPGDRDIFIADIRQLYFPSLELQFNLLSIDYNASVLQGPSGKMVYRGDDLKECRICNHPIAGQAILCDTCGRATHAERFMKSRTHGFHCKKCGRTTCRFDCKWAYRWLIFKRLLCPSCASEAEKEGQKTYAMKPLSGDKSSAG
jgi:restriction system protein